MGTIYLVTKTHGDEVDGRHIIHINKLKYYLFDVYSIQEIKYEELINLLKEEQYIEMSNDEDNLPKIVNIADLEGLRSILVFVNQEKLKEDEKKTKVSARCERLLEKIIDQLKAKGAKGDKEEADLSAILAECDEKKIPANQEDLRDAITVGLCGDIVVGDYNKLSCMVNYKKLLKVFPALRLQNAINSHNEKKSGGNKYT